MKIKLKGINPWYIIPNYGSEKIASYLPLAVCESGKIYSNMIIKYIFKIFYNYHLLSYVIC